MDASLFFSLYSKTSISFGPEYQSMGYRKLGSIQFGGVKRALGSLCIFHRAVYFGCSCLCQRTHGV